MSGIMKLLVSLVPAAISGVSSAIDLLRKKSPPLKEPPPKLDLDTVAAEHQKQADQKFAKDKPGL